MALIDFTLSNARRFYSSMGNPSGLKGLITEKQWAYRRGYSTELLLVHLTEIRRRALDSGNVVAVAFVDFRKAFDSVSHEILLKKSGI